MNELKKDILWRVILVYAFVFLAAVAIIAKVVYIQFYQGKQWKDKAVEDKLRYETVEAVRGNIYDCMGHVLASSIPIFDIRMDAASTEISDDYFYAHVDSLAWHLSELFGDRTKVQYLRDLKQARDSGNRYYLIKRNITYEELGKVRQFPIFRLGRYAGGLIAEEHSVREMPFQFLAERTIGYESREAPVYVGLEGAFSKHLQGINGQRLVKKIASGIWVPVSENYDIEPKNGDDIITTLDITLQDVAEHALLRQLSEQEADHGCVVLMEVRTGYIRAIANLGRTDDGTYEEIYNYAIGESGEPGSVFKLASMMAALENKKISIHDLVYTGNGITRYANRVMRDVHPVGNGYITVKEAFEHSSNVGISRIITDAYGDNPREFCDQLYLFGLNQKLGIEIAGEGVPLIKNPGYSSWSKVTLPWMSIGYEVSLTPLQILTLYNAVANNGKMVKPLFVKEIRRSGVVVQTFDPFILNPSVCSPSTICDLKVLMEGVIENGTGKLLNNTAYKVAGKTGTAQVADRDEGYDKKNYKASFVGYFPADHPVYSCIVVINNPGKGTYYGSQIAAPVFREIADKIYATRLDIQTREGFRTDTVMLPDTVKGYWPDMRYIFATLSNVGMRSEFDSLWALAIPENGHLRYTGITVSDTTVPDLRGMGARDVMYLTEKLGLNPVITGRGKVIHQSLHPGAPIKKGETIILTLSLTENLPATNDSIG